MAKLAKMAPQGPPATVQTVGKAPDTFTREGAPGFTYDTLSQLFLLAVTNMVGEDTFYERAADRDDRYSALVRSVAASDPEWLLAFITWLRGDGNMRTASIVAAVEGGDVLAGTTYPRRLLAAALQRADEPAEALGLWLATRGKPVPSWLKKGLADAAERLYSPYAVFKYDTAGAPIRFADVVELAEPRHLTPSPERDVLWAWLLDRRHGNNVDEEVSLPMVRARAIMDSIPQPERTGRLTAEMVRAAGHTWESVASYLGGPWTAAAWEAVIPSMGYMALLRNLRNFDQAGISPATAKAVAERLADPEQVARSRQLPMRFLSAYNALQNDRYKVAVGDALQHSLANVPQLPGDSLVLIDTSGSMHAPFSRDGSLMRWDAAAVFGIAFALANGLPDVQSFSNSAYYMAIPKGASLLKLVQDFQHGYMQGGGTNTVMAIRDAVRRRPDARRAIILTDEQAHGSYFSEGSVPDALALVKGNTYTFNLAGYAVGMAATADRHYTVGGLTDAGFRTIATLDAGRGQGWPWEAKA